MRKRINGSMTVEAAMLYPYFLLDILISEHKNELKMRVAPRLVN